MAVVCEPRNFPLFEFSHHSSDKESFLKSYTARRNYSLSPVRQKSLKSGLKRRTVSQSPATTTRSSRIACSSSVQQNVSQSSVRQNSPPLKRPSPVRQMPTPSVKQNTSPQSVKENSPLQSPVKQSSSLPVRSSPSPVRRNSSSISVKESLSLKQDTSLRQNLSPLPMKQNAASLVRRNSTSSSSSSSRVSSPARKPACSYYVPKTAEEAMNNLICSAFNPPTELQDSDNKSFDGDEETSHESFSFTSVAKQNLKDTLLQVALRKGYIIYYYVYRHTNGIQVNAKAGRFVCKVTSRKKEDAERQASLKLLNLLKRQPDVNIPNSPQGTTKDVLSYNSVSVSNNITPYSNGSAIFTDGPIVSDINNGANVSTNSVSIASGNSNNDILYSNTSPIDIPNTRTPCNTPYLGAPYNSPYIPAKSPYIQAPHNTPANVKNPYTYTSMETPFTTDTTTDVYVPLRESSTECLSSDVHDPITQLDVIARVNKWDIPKYVIEPQTTNSLSYFLSTVVTKQVSGIGMGMTIQIAKATAAANILFSLQYYSPSYLSKENNTSPDSNSSNGGILPTPPISSPDNVSVNNQHDEISTKNPRHLPYSNYSPFRCQDTKVSCDKYKDTLYSQISHFHNNSNTKGSQVSSGRFHNKTDSNNGYADMRGVVVSSSFLEKNKGRGRDEIKTGIDSRGRGRDNKEFKRPFGSESIRLGRNNHQEMWNRNNQGMWSRDNNERKGSKDNREIFSGGNQVFRQDNERVFGRVNQGGLNREGLGRGLVIKQGDEDIRKFGGGRGRGLSGRH